MRYYRNVVPAGDRRDLHAGRNAAADTGVGLEDVRAPGLSDRRKLARRIHPLADGDRHWKAASETRKALVLLRGRLLEEGDVKGREPVCEAHRVVRRVAPIGVYHDIEIAADMVPHGADAGESALCVRTDP